MKNNQNTYKSKPIAQFSRGFLVLVIVMFSFFTLVSAWDWDNVKSYDSKTKTVTITNALGLGADIATIQLVDNTDICFTECSALLKLNGYNGDYQNILSELNFKNINGDKTSIKSYKYEWVSFEEYEIDIPEYKQGKCYKAVNGSQTCDTQYVGTHKEIRTREIKVKDYSSDDTLKDVSYLRIYGYKNKEQSVDWIPTLYGVKIKDWAWWSSVPPLAYWTLNETSGNANDTSGYGRNLTNINGAIYGDGKFGNALLNLNNTAYLNLSAPTDDVFQLAQQPFTIIVWANRSQGIPPTINKNFLTQGEPGAVGCSGWTFGLRGTATTQGNLVTFITRNGTTGNANNFFAGNQTANYTDGKWHMFVATRNSEGNLTIYADNINVGSVVNNDNLTYDKNLGGCAGVGDGIKVGGGSIGGSGTEFWNGSLDDIGIYNLSITESDIEDLWNNGIGLPQAELGALKILVSLNLPLDNTNTILSQMSFNSSASISHGNFTNATAYLWYNNGSVFKTNYTEVSGTEYNSTSLSFSGIPIGSFEWNVKYCGKNETGSLCNFADNNFTFTRAGFLENNLTVFNTSTYETAIEGYWANVSIDNSSFSTVTANLIYNGTPHPASCSLTGNTSICSASVNVIPLNMVEIENRTFYWEYNIDGTLWNSTSQYQTVNMLNLSSCNTAVSFMNFTFKNETTALEDVEASITTSWTYYLQGTGVLNRTLSYTNSTEHSNYSFCFTPADRKVNVILSMTYINAESQQRNYEATSLLSNVTTNVVLYLLPTSAGLFSQFQTITADGSPLATVKGLITRTIGGATVTIASKFTDDSGFVNYFLNPDFIYTALFTKSGYPDNSFTFTPMTDLRTVIMGTAVSEIGNGTVISANTTYITYPINSSLNNNTDYTFGLNVSSSQTITLISLNITNSSGTQLLFDSDTGQGYISGIVNTGNLTSIIGYYVITTADETISFSRVWMVGVEFVGEYSLYRQLKLYLTYGFKIMFQYLIVLASLIALLIFMSTNETLDTSESKIIAVLLLVWFWSVLGWLNTGLIVNAGTESINELGRLSSKYGIAILTTAGASIFILRRVFISRV